MHVGRRIQIENMRKKSEKNDTQGEKMEKMHVGRRIQIEKM